MLEPPREHGLSMLVLRAGKSFSKRTRSLQVPNADFMVEFFTVQPINDTVSDAWIEWEISS
jgi:hypothetical protein